MHSDMPTAMTLESVLGIKFADFSDALQFSKHRPKLLREKGREKFKEKASPRHLQDSVTCLKKSAGLRRSRPQ
jgi:hypothetical protein